MEEKLMDFFKIFLEKYLMSTVLAIVLSFLAYYRTPEDSSFLIKFGVLGYSVFLFCIFFLFVKFIIALENKIKYLLTIIFSEDDSELYRKQALELLWTKVDEMYPRDYELLLKFIESGNKPYYTSETYCGDSLLTSNWVYKKQVSLEDPIDQLAIKEKEKKEFMEGYRCISSNYKYILKEEIYQVLKYSMDKYGKISHFKREN